MASSGRVSLTYNLTHCYLEVARGALTAIHHPSLSIDEVLDAHGHKPLVNAVLGLVSMRIVYSFLALESFINYQLFRIWERRSDGSAEALRFRAEVGDVPVFEKLKTHRKVRELPERIKTLCRILAYPSPPQAMPSTWQQLNELVETSRHFLVHPYPDPLYFSSNMRRIMTETRADTYVTVVEDILKFFYEKSGKSAPPWLSKNTLLRFRGVDLLVDDPSAV